MMSEQAAASVTPIEVAKRLARLMWPRDQPGVKARVVGAFALILVGKLISVGAPFLYKNVIDTLSNPGALAPIALIVAYASAETIHQLTAELRQFLFVAVSQRALRLTSLDVFRKLHSLPLQYHLERKTGGLATIIARGTGGVEFLLELCLFNILPTLVELALVAAVLFRLYDASFALIVIATITVYLVFTFCATQWQMRFRREMNALDARASMTAIDSLINYDTIKYFNAEDREAERFNEARASYADAAIRNQSTQFAINAGRLLVITVGSASIMLLAGRQVAAGGMTVGDFVLVNAYLLQLYAPLGALGMVYTQVRRSLTDVEAMFSLFKQESPIADPADANALVVPNGKVTFDRVAFGYDDRAPLLRDISFDIPAGKTVAVVGPSGAGKSTLARLLFRFFDVTGGAIRIDGVDIRDVTQDSLRQAIGVVPQDTVLFHDTLRRNIAFGASDASDEDIARVVDAAQLSALIASLPDGLDTQVGERGLKLSGGEKQRVAIARVLLKNPPLLIFDEATSALDSETEREIVKSLKSIAAARTTLVIAHRLSTIADAHEIIVLENGAIAERGDHHKLLAKNGLYAALWRKQQHEADEQEKIAI